MHRLLSLITASLCLIATTLSPANAADLSVNAGLFNVLRSGDQAIQFGAEYRFDAWNYDIRPIIGGFGTNDGSAYGYAGLNWDIEILTNELYVIPNFAVGAYHEGAGKDLGGVLEFRSGIEVAYQLPNRHRIGIALNHLSNASIYDRNPGTESVILTYSMPIASLY